MSLLRHQKKKKKKDFNFVCKGSKHLFGALQLLYTRASFSREATAMGQRFLYQSDLIFQSIKSVITTRANTAIALQSACDRAAFGVFLLRQNRRELITGKMMLDVSSLVWLLHVRDVSVFIKYFPDIYNLNLEQLFQDHLKHSRQQ